MECTERNKQFFVLRDADVYHPRYQLNWVFAVKIHISISFSLSYEGHAISGRVVFYNL